MQVDKLMKVCWPSLFQLVCICTCRIPEWQDSVQVADGEVSMIWLFLFTSTVIKLSHLHQGTEFLR